MKKTNPIERHCPEQVISVFQAIQVTESKDELEVGTDRSLEPLMI